MYYPDEEILITEEDMNEKGHGIICDISVPSAQFCCEPKTALKYKGYKGS